MMPEKLLKLVLLVLGLDSTKVLLEFTNQILTLIMQYTNAILLTVMFRNQKWNSKGWNWGVTHKSFKCMYISFRVVFYMPWLWLLKPQPVLSGPKDNSHTTESTNHSCSTCTGFNLLYHKINSGNSKTSFPLLSYLLMEGFKEWLRASEVPEVSAGYFLLRSKRNCL